MTFLLLSLGMLLAGALAAPLAARTRGRRGAVVGAAACVGGGVAGLLATATVLFGSGPFTVALPTLVPRGVLALHVDSLSAVFLLPVFLLLPAVALHGAGGPAEESAPTTTGWTWFFFDLLAAATVIALSARSAVAFLASWEVVALTAFFLLAQGGLPRRAAGRFLAGAQVAALLVLAFHAPLVQRAVPHLGAAAAGGPGAAVGLALFIALAGFGAAAILAPVHLATTRSAVPGHVSAALSGQVVGVGIYGLLRAILLLGPPPWWVGLVAGAAGVMTATAGVHAARGRQDLGQLIACGSVANLGIIGIGLGVSLVGLSTYSAITAILGFAGVLFQALGRTLFDGLLLLAAGSVADRTGTLDLDELGGLLPRMADTGATFLAGVAAAVALPPFNGFAGQLLICAASLALLTTVQVRFAWPAAAAVASLALIEGGALRAYARAFGTAFLGPLRARNATVSEAPRARRVPLHFLAVLCAVLGVFPVLGVLVVVRPVFQLTATLPTFRGDALASLFQLAWWPTRLAAALGLLAAITAILAWIAGRIRNRPGAVRRPVSDPPFARAAPRRR